MERDGFCSAAEEIEWESDAKLGSLSESAARQHPKLAENCKIYCRRSRHARKWADKLRGAFGGLRVNFYRKSFKINFYKKTEQHLAKIKWEICIVVKRCERNPHFWARTGGKCENKNFGK